MWNAWRQPRTKRNSVAQLKKVLTSDPSVVIRAVSPSTLVIQPLVIPFMQFSVITLTCSRVTACIGMIRLFRFRFVQFSRSKSRSLVKATQPEPEPASYVNYAQYVSLLRENLHHEKHKVIKFHIRDQDSHPLSRCVRVIILKSSSTSFIVINEQAFDIRM